MSWRSVNLGGASETADRRPLVFMHIPKTSGIAVAHALVEAVRPQRVFFGFDRAFFGGFSDFGSVAPETRAFIHFSPDTLPHDEALVRAHMSLSTLRAAYPQGRFMTVLREPVCRVLSHFVFWRGFSPAQLAPWGGWADISREAQGPLASFLESPRAACQIDNVAARLLLWPHRLIPDDGMIDPAHDSVLLREAAARMAGLDFVDIIDSAGFTARLAAFLGTTPEAERHNETPALPAELHTDLAAELTPAARASLAARTRIDAEVWRLVATERGEDAEALRRSSIDQGMVRFAKLLAPDQEKCADQAASAAAKRAAHESSAPSSM